MDNSEIIEIKDDKNSVDVECQEENLPEQPQRQFGPPKKFRNNYRNDRYNNAYGDYSGGYGPPGGGYGRNFRPPRNYGPRGYFPIPDGPPPFYQGPPGPPGPQGPPGNFMWGRGFGPGGPPIRRQPMDDKTIRYLLRCGVAKEYVRNLPRDLLQLMEPEFCGLCAQSFDSFAMSRIHYISKNHLKNQKKWLTQQSEIGFRRAKEIPLKARELYCELCDVHITSKTHSESHYAGKPHRAIVEGRKNPKNPFLLQQGMEDRVEQLIRREKKNLKPIEEDEAPEKDAKVIQPDLYCDICKTSVTCSEQMTMHLNGKKHLSKEKQHILKMMKGGNGTQSQEKQTEDTTVEENENAEEEGEESYDWGQGEEKWEETAENEWY
ncbi:uncharacterized protein LOC124541454 isoform X1 [Vanessa cardui]|uniref:uncharacterized protein LOC124541454 isoform X1 n=2 Tax=Vanessa cardui TaxID=171605 RepID=UPI001F129F1E|nr:uncharacterized protein LOC124541454 isoform X1 [Vanessa cardui]